MTNAGVQETISMVLVVCAFAYLLHRLSGWPKKRKAPEPKVIVGERLQRGLKKRTSEHNCCE